MTAAAPLRVRPQRGQLALDVLHHNTFLATMPNSHEGDGSPILRANGEQRTSPTDGVSEWLGRNLLPVVVALLLSVLTWNVSQMNEKLDSLSAGQVAGQIRATQSDGEVRAVRAEAARNTAEIEKLKALHNR